ncbi:AzlD family protein [Limobrevibacterium gyesilva]|uniref:AzlD domain-containing protein n=1 Tax=Limobrevibacterium gyesilva TaxID=2991712 RepID=A0AA41YN77_9PROT|nr:AzlD domain-containing protein [Limobrevibacterium gyesilva]
MAESWLVIAALTVGTYAIRLSGVLLGQRIPRNGAWARALNALPGCLIVSLVSVSILSGGPEEWGAGIVAAAVAVLSRNLPLTMASGIASIWLLRHFG